MVEILKEDLLRQGLAREESGQFVFQRSNDLERGHCRPDEIQARHGAEQQELRVLQVILALVLLMLEVAALLKLVDEETKEWLTSANLVIALLDMFLDYRVERGIGTCSIIGPVLSLAELLGRVDVPLSLFVAYVVLWWRLHGVFRQ